MRHGRRRRYTGVWVGAALAGLLAALAGSFPADRGQATEDGRPPGSGPAAPAGTHVGAFLGSGPEGVRRIAEMERWLGGTELRAGHTYLPGDRWSNIEGQPEFLRPWTDWRRGKSDRMLVLNVPMAERNEEGVPDREVRQLLRSGAQGRFDKHFRTLAERLVGLGAPDTVIVLGWEMNGTTYTHRCAPDPRAWKVYWRRIVAAMRSVPGQEFRFDFTPSRGTDAIGWTRCYPGDDVVDIIGMDSYDQPPGNSFDDHVDQPYGLQFHVDFAAARGKPISFPEWGLFRSGDNPVYMRRMLAWIAQHRPLYHTISDYCPHGVWLCKENPRSSAVFRSALSRRTRPPGPRPATAPRPGGPPPPDDPPPTGSGEPREVCFPSDPGDTARRTTPDTAPREVCVRLDSGWWRR
ncbi:glycosyl hydrolase [Streptomyces sp. ACA25]|uniref:glycoside hydrolase family 26 protein n=1 Tax=Streptomyces sp. ACA25 TaxID=3022596 RepID=UPI002307B5AB|nr:glycosyl hydrolase [Streptomyces sp. ACA25]MDB1086303.1 glycosyl hydrolase [Streptomyces sp. ACA25]